MERFSFAIFFLQLSTSNQIFAPKLLIISENAKGKAGNNLTRSLFEIIRQIPISRSMLYRWIAKFAEANGLKESTDMSKNTAKGQPQSTTNYADNQLVINLRTTFTHNGQEVVRLF